MYIRTLRSPDVADSGGTTIDQTGLWPTAPANSEPPQRPEPIDTPAAPVAADPTAPAPPPAFVPPTPPTPVGPLPTALTPEAITAAVRGALPQAPAAEPSTADYERIFKVFKPTVAHVEAILNGGEPALVALNQVVNGIATQSLTMAQQYVDYKLEQMGQQIAPLQQATEQQNLNRLESEFKVLHPDLADPKIRPLMEAEVIRMREAKMSFASPAEAFKHVADKTRALCAQLGIPLGATQAQPAAPRPQPAPVTTGGQAGAAPQSVSQNGRPVNQLAKHLYG